MQKDVSKTMGLLKMALNNTDLAQTEVRQHISQAITKLENAAQRDKPRHTQAQQWWGTVVAGTAASPTSPHAGTAASPTSPHAGMRSLKELDAMISAQQKKINDLERSVQEKTAPKLLQD